MSYYNNRCSGQEGVRWFASPLWARQFLAWLQFLCLILPVTPPTDDGRVETWRGGLGAAYLFSGPFGCRCLTSQSVLRFHVPLIEPDV